MNYRNVELHGIHELVDVRGRQVMSRYPQKVNKEIQHDVAYQMVGGEIRLVPLGPCSITIGSLFCWTQAKCLVFYGDYASPEEYLFNKQITLSINAHQPFPNQTVQMPEALCKPHVFDHQVVRIVLLGEAFYLKEIFGEYRLPKATEVPDKRMLVYGTSISQGLCATSPELSYASFVARKLGYDLYNYGLSGNAFCEAVVSDFLATSNLYDLIVLELSVNMLTSNYPLAIFTQRVQYLLEQLLAKQPKAKIYCIGILPFYADYGLVREGETLSTKPDEYRQAFAQIVKDMGCSKLHYVDPKTLLSVHNLSSDLLHPSNLGMLEIAEGLSNFIKSKK